MGDGPHAVPICGPAAGRSGYWNDYYPDVDDTAPVAIAIARAADKHRNALERAAE